MSGSDVAHPPLSPGEPRSFGGGRYVVQRRLGAGNFATVYLAYDDRLDVRVAVKLLSDRWSWEPEVRGRFVQEARLLRSLNDSRVVQIRDIAETEDGRPYLVMDFATEGTLEQRMYELAQRGVRPGPFQLRVVARAIADALGVLHERRIAHRDIKPSNMLITRTSASPSLLDPGKAAGFTDDAVLRPGERLMLGDLGLAKDLAFDSGITVGVGTAGYMAPEQTLPGAKIDVRTDIYAASALLAQIASGEAPDPVRRVSSGRVETGRPLPDNISPVLAQALLRGLDADPDGRPQTIEQWHAEIDAALIAIETSRAPAPPAPPGPTAPGSPGSPTAPTTPPGPTGPGAPGPAASAGTPTAPGAAPRPAPPPAPSRPVPPPPPPASATSSPGAHVSGPGAHVSDPGAHVSGPGVRASDPGAHVSGPGVRVSGPGAHVSDPGVHVPSPGAPVAPPPVAPSPGGPSPGGPPPRPARAGLPKRWLVGGIAAAVIAIVAIVLATRGGDGDTTGTADELDVRIVGPIRVTAGELATWRVVFDGDPVSGTWDLVSSVFEPDPSEWEPGDIFQGQWNFPDDKVTLVLTVEDEDGNEASDEITFVVEEAAG